MDVASMSDKPFLLPGGAEGDKEDVRPLCVDVPNDALLLVMREVPVVAPDDPEVGILLLQLSAAGFDDMGMCAE
jgi:hypothetical protein